MRPNSLLFDREKNQGLLRTMSILVTVVFLVVSGYILIRYKRFAYLLHGELFGTPMFGFLLLGYLALAVAAVFLIRWANCRVKRMPALWALAIFLVALLPRVLILLALRAPAFGGELFSRLNLSALFLAENLPSLFACTAGSLSAVAVYLVARRFDDGSAPAAGLLFALYPANMISCLHQPVMQAVVLFALLSVLFALEAFAALKPRRAVAFSALSGLALAACGFALASVWLMALAFGLFWLILLLSSFGQEGEPRRLLLLALAFCAVLFTLRIVSLASPLRGSLDADLSGATAPGAALQAREGEALLDSLDWETLQKGYDLQGKPVRLDQNLAQLWLEKDAALTAATGSAAFFASELAPFAQGIRLMDFFYVAGVLLFAWIGGLLRRRGGAGDLLLLVFLVWALAHLFSDRQAITRALGMPILMILASFGVFAIVGTEPRPKEHGKYASCVNRGALNFGELPPTDAGLERKSAFHPQSGGSAHSAKKNSLYAAMEADMSQQKQQSNHPTGGFEP